MIDFRDPASIRAWIAQRPAVHLRQLRALYRLPLFAPFREAMEQAGKTAKEAA